MKDRCVIFYCIFIFAFLFTIRASAQFDSSYAIRYPDKLGLSLFQSRPSYEISIDQKLNRNISGVSNLKYNTVAKDVSGFGFFYDKISLFIGVSTPSGNPDKDRKGKTAHSQLALAITGAKLRIEASSRTYRGFYDNNSPEYLPDFNDTLPYFQNANQDVRSLKLKILYFVNAKKRFSYGAAYVNNVRQVRSAGSMTISANLYSYSIKAPSIVPVYVDTFYNPWQNWNLFRVTGISGGFGYTQTIAIFNKAFVNLLFDIGLEGQHIISTTSDNAAHYDAWKLAFSSYDFRSSFGYNTQSFFFSIQTIIDGNNYRLFPFDVRNQFISAFANIGYRFHVKTPGFYKKIQQTKVYKMI